MRGQGVSEAEGSRQRIFVGDVQGCADELEELVARASAAFGDDFALWCSGDLINRGPDNRRPLELMRRLIEEGRGEYILGNHEIAYLSVGLGLREPGPNDSIGDLLGSRDAGEWLDWVRARPLVVSGRIADQPFAMVHAASHPDWSLADLVEAADGVQARLSGSRSAARDFLASGPAEDPVRDRLGRLTRCRSVTPEGGWSSDEPVAPAQAWHEAWALRGHEHGLVYGHWAMQGLHVATGLRGLDTGCVHHGRGKDGFLTAWLPESMPRADGRRPFDVPDDRFWQVRAKRRYYFPVGDAD
jgi:bis(5'-nucleosyl)-tetraphosphatase (symmetrical)